MVAMENIVEDKVQDVNDIEDMQHENFTFKTDVDDVEALPSLYLRELREYTSWLLVSVTINHQEIGRAHV
jgi:hypothetical protein